MTGILAFPDDFDSATQGGRAYFGRDVLTGLVNGIRSAQFAESARSSRWRWGSCVLGCAMWMDDPGLLDALGDLAATCIVVTKQGGDVRSRARVKKLQQASGQMVGIPQEAFPELFDLAPPKDGLPLMVGPGTPGRQAVISAVRELGFRRVDEHLVPIVHAKLLLLGRLGWTDEHPSGHLVDEIYFVPEQLWIGSANFTATSRESLEMGAWTGDRDLLLAGRRFLLALIAMSEPLGTPYAVMEPELMPVMYDDEAIFEHLAEVALGMDEDDG